MNEAFLWSSCKVLKLVVDFNSLCFDSPVKDNELLSISYNALNSILLGLVDARILSEFEYNELIENVYNPTRSDYYILYQFKVCKNGDRTFSFRHVVGNSPAEQELHI